MEPFLDWEGTNTLPEVVAGISHDFRADGALDNATLYFAEYTYEGYSGDATVVFERDGKLFEVNGGHCSCYGLEGQWEPTETSWEAIAMRPKYIGEYAKRMLEPLPAPPTR